MEILGTKKGFATQDYVAGSASWAAAVGDAVSWGI